MSKKKTNFKQKVNSIELIFVAIENMLSPHPE